MKKCVEIRTMLFKNLKYYLNYHTKQILSHIDITPQLFIYKHVFQGKERVSTSHVEAFLVIP